MPLNLPGNVTLVGNDKPSEAVSRNYYTYRNQAVSDTFMAVVTLDNNTLDLVGAECKAFRQNSYTHLIALSMDEMKRLEQDDEALREAHATLISKAVMLLGLKSGRRSVLDLLVFSGCNLKGCVALIFRAECREQGWSEVQITPAFGRP